MVPVIANRGASFAGAFAYYCHDKNAWTTQRVAWTECLNLMTGCVEKAWRRMAYTAMHQKELKRASGQCMTGAKMQKPVFCYSLSWHPEQNPSKQAMMEAVMETLSVLGLVEHQAVVAAHTDEPHAHAHVVVNATHPMTGLVAKLKDTKRKLSKFALNYERKEGKVYCPKREENHAKREAGMKTKYCDPIIMEAWETSSNGAEFVSQLTKHDYQLAKGRRLVVIDPHGNVINPARALGVKAKEFKEGIQGMGKGEIPALDDVLRNRLIDTVTGSDVADVDGQTATKDERMENQPELDAIQAEVSRLKRKLREDGVFSRLFGLHAYRKRKLVQVRQQFRDVANVGSSMPELEEPIAK